jgi:hypothetical protein
VIFVMDDQLHLVCDLVKSFGYFESWAIPRQKARRRASNVQCKASNGCLVDRFALRRQEFGGLDRMHTHCIHTPNQELVYHTSKVDGISIVADDRYTSVVI